MRYEEAYWTTSHFEHVMLRLETKAGGKAVILVRGEPTVLANVPAESLFANGLEDLLGE